MQTDTTRAIARPQHLFDLPAATVWTLAGAGNAILNLAHALDRALEDRHARREEAQRPRARLGPGDRTPAEFGVTDIWRIR